MAEDGGSSTYEKSWYILHTVFLCTRATIYGKKSKSHCIVCLLVGLAGIGKLLALVGQYVRYGITTS